MTTEPNSATAGINHERSPVLLAPDDERDAWLEGSTTDALADVCPMAGVRLSILRAGLEKVDAAYY